MEGTRKLSCVKFGFVLLLGFTIGWVIFPKQTVLKFVPELFSRQRIEPEIVYADSVRIPSAPAGRLWPEERFRFDHGISDIRELADPRFSTMRLEGKPAVEIGDTVHVTVTLYDGYNRTKKIGGDLIRVWMREQSLNASANGKVVDNNDGSYTAILTAFWVGQPEIVAAIISPREVKAYSLKRRYILPNVLMNTAVFEHPADPSVAEETPCNYDPQVPGYAHMCNLTEENYRLPWYCGKPKTLRLSCSDWTMVGSRNLWQLGIEQQRLTPLELDLLSPEKKPMVLHQKIKIFVKEGYSQRSPQHPMQCNNSSVSVTWNKGSPTGYLYNRKWYGKFCRREPEFGQTFKQCLHNTQLVTIGDSTMRQLFMQFAELMPCNWTTETWSNSGKHRPVTCADASVNFTMTYALHQLPFCSQDTPRHYFKSLRAYKSDMQAAKKTVIMINLFAHFLNLHSHVIFESLRRVRRDVSKWLEMDPNLTVVIKGPHAYSFARNPDSVLWMPDIYANIYQDYLYEIFHDLYDRVIYLDAFDMTVSSEQWHIHSERFLIRELALNILGYIC